MNQFECYGQAAASSRETDFTLLSGRYRNQTHLIPLIVEDILSKVKIVNMTSFLEIGCGAGNLLLPLSTHFDKIFGCDHKNLLQKLIQRSGPNNNIHLIEGNFLDAKLVEKFDFILLYSVIHCMESTDQIYDLIDKAVNTLSDHGALLIGDIPNVSLKNRFLSSEIGKQFDLNWKKSISSQAATPNDYLNMTSTANSPIIDDNFILHLINNYNTKGFNVYRLPQPSCLPFGNTREDLLLMKPSSYTLNRKKINQ